MKRSLPVLLVALAALSAGVALWWSRPAPVSDRPNVLILLWDTARADRMSLYGHHRPTTPFLERFAADARVWEHAVATSEWTGPTHASLFTGLPLRTHGMDTYYRWLDDEHLTLAERLTDVGYDTWAFTGNRFVSDHVNMLQGFGTREHTYERRWRQAAASATRDKLIPRDRSTEISPGWRNQGHGDGWSKQLTLVKDAAPVAHRAFGEWLDQGRDPSRPFFAFINLMEAHGPRVPSMASRQALLDEAMIEQALTVDATLFAVMAYTSGKHTYTEAELEAMRGTYDAALLDLDRAAEAMIADLAARGLLENTVVVLTSDHGELLGEHHMYNHRWALYEGLVRVPLLIRYPRAVPPGRVGASVSVAQVPSTLTGLLGVEALPGAAPGLLSGGIKPLVTELRDPNRVMAVVTRAFPDVSPGQFARSLAAIFDGDLKLIRASDGHHELYDLAADPTEEANLVAARPEEAARLLDELAAWEASTQAHPGPHNRRAPRSKVDAETREMLEILGYAADEQPP